MLLNKTAAPTLPNGDLQYKPEMLDKYSRILRLYFNQIDNVTQNLLGARGGKYLDFPYAAIQRTTNKTFTANTATEITFDQNDFLNGCENDGTNGIQVNQTGLYNYQFSAQFANTDSQAHNAWTWLRVNNVDVAGTGSKVSVPSKHGTSDGYLIFAANFYVQLNAGDYVKFFAAVSQAYAPTGGDGVYLEAYPALTTPFAVPSAPSVAATLTFVSAVL